MRSKRSLLIGSSVILLCLCLIFGATYALFTDEERVSNHLVAGDLDVVLLRTDLEYAVLDAEGYLDPVAVPDDLDFTNATLAEKNVFGMDSSDLFIVPGSYFDAEMKVLNNANTAFDYEVKLYMTGDYSDLAGQIKVTVTHPDGTVSESILSDMNVDDEPLFVGHLSAKQEGKESAETFSVMLTFLDDAVVNTDDNAENDIESNNAAKNDAVTFDLVVSAVQQTKRPA